MNIRRNTVLIFSIIVFIIVFLLLNLVLGSVSIPFTSVWNVLTGGEGEPVAWQNIVWKSRLPQALTALVAGAGLSISGYRCRRFSESFGRVPSVLGISPEPVWELLSLCFFRAIWEGSL